MVSTQPNQPYICYRTPTPLIIDGHLNEPAWHAAPRSPRFVDIVHGTPAHYETNAAVLWDNDNLYVGFWIEEPFVRAQITERDGLIFLENDVEVFIDGGDTYYEFEINALGTIYEVFFIWQDAYQRGGKFDVAEFDLLDRKALSFGGNYDRSERVWAVAAKRIEVRAFPGHDEDELELVEDGHVIIGHRLDGDLFQVEVTPL